ncbi:MAG: hypothetical protein U0R52_10685 [Solirubrobacterales bacterium]
MAIGRTAVAVGHLPDSGPIVRLTRGRAWIPVIGVLLIGIVALNVLTLSFAASAGKIDEQIQTLEQENSILRTREANLLTNERIGSAAAGIGLYTPAPTDVNYRDAGSDVVREAARRLAASG